MSEVFVVRALLADGTVQSQTVEVLGRDVASAAAWIEETPESIVGETPVRYEMVRIGAGGAVTRGDVERVGAQPTWR